MERSESCVERARLLGDIGEVTPNVEPPGRFEAGLRIKNTDTLECSARVIDDSRLATVVARPGSPGRAKLEHRQG